MLSIRTVWLSAAIVASSAAMPAQAADSREVFCSVYAGTSAAVPIATTEVFYTSLSNDNLSDEFQRFVYDASKKRVAVPFDTSQEVRGICLTGGENVRGRHIDFFRQRGLQIMSIRSPLDSRGYYRPNRAAPAVASAKPVVPAAPRPPVTSAPIAKGPTPNQLKYQRELAAHQQRLAEIEQIKAAALAQLANNKANAQQVIDQHRLQMDENRRQVAAADRARRQYEQEVAAQQAQAKQLRTKQDREALVNWPEAVTVCELNAQDAQSKFGNWRCQGPLQFTYAKLANGGPSDARAMVNISDACGGKVESVRDLGTVGGYRVFGCSFGLHPNRAQRSSTDSAERFGLTYIPGRNVYRCPTWHSGCRA